MKKASNPKKMEPENAPAAPKSLKTRFLSGAPAFSRNRLIVFALVFAAIGGYVLFRSFAASGTPYSATSSISDGATYSGTITWTITPTPTPKEVDFYIDGNKDAHPDTAAPFNYQGTSTGALDTTKLTNGNHTLQENLIYSSGAVVTLSHPIIVSNSTGGVACTTSTTAWQNNSIAVQTGSFTASFSVTPSTAGMDADLGFSNGAGSAYTNFGPIFDTDNTGIFDVRNAGTYTYTNKITYVAGTTYQVQMVINITSHTYSVYVTAPGGSPVTVASNFAFRSEQAAVTQLNNWGLVDTSGSEQVCNMQISASITNPVPTPQPSGGGSGTSAGPVSFTTNYTPTYYVSNNGSDSNSGTSSSSPWKTISKVASTCLKPGNVVAFQGGQTFSDTYLDVSCSGTSASHVVFTSYGTGQAILAGGIWFNGGHHDVTLDNLEMIDTAGSIIASCGSCGAANPAYDITVQNSYIHNTPGVGIEPNYGYGWVISNNTITNTGDSGIINYYTTSSTITHNAITNTGGNTSITYGKHGIYSKGTNSTISYNIFSGNANGQSISIRTHGQYIYGNVIHDTYAAIAFFDYDTAAPPQGTTYIYNNLTYNITGYNFYYDNQTDPQGNSPTVNFVLANNTFVDSSSSAEQFNLSLVPSGATVTTVNNIFSGTFGSAYRSCATCTEHYNLWYGGSSNKASGASDIFANPLLNSAPALSLQSGSPAVNKGTTSVPGLSYTVSSDGAPLHYQGSAPDLGAVESSY